MKIYPVGHWVQVFVLRLKSGFGSLQAIQAVPLKKGLLVGQGTPFTGEVTSEGFFATTLSKEFGLVALGANGEH